jgi:hypothetical protein
MIIYIYLQVINQIINLVPTRITVILKWEILRLTEKNRFILIWVRQGKAIIC